MWAGHRAEGEVGAIERAMDLFENWGGGAQFRYRSSGRTGAWYAD